MATKKFLKKGSIIQITKCGGLWKIGIDTMLSIGWLEIRFTLEGVIGFESSHFSLEYSFSRLKSIFFIPFGEVFQVYILSF